MTDPFERFAEALLLPFINRTMEIVMPSIFMEYTPISRAGEYYEFLDLGVYQEWLKVMTSHKKARCVLIIGIPPGKNYILVEWDSNKLNIIYTYHTMTPIAAVNTNNPPTPQAGAQTGASNANQQIAAKQYVNHKTGATEERPPDPPTWRTYQFTSRSPTGTLTERTFAETDLAEMVRAQQRLHPDDLIISITYKGDA